MDEFIIIPRSIIHNKSIGDKRILIYSSIFFSGWSGKNFNELVQYSHYSACRDKGSVLNQYKNVVSHLMDNNYLSVGYGGMVYNKKEEGFGIIYYSEFQRIMQERQHSLSQGKRINHAHLLLLLAHIRLCMIHKSKTPEIYSNLLIRISESIGLSVRSISSCLKTLEKLNIIHNEELPRYKDDDGYWHSNVRIFVNMELRGKPDINYDWCQEVVAGVQYIIANQNL